ncbi:MAG: ABC transporter permease [Clostridiales bacterium]|nr:ABC transporter permease [Clostridiales bacterium]
MNNTKSPTAISSTKTFLWRSMLKIKSAPGQMIFDSIVAIVSMLLFAFLFGGAINGSPKEYVQFLLPGMLFMTVLPMTVYAGAALSKDISTGVYDRFRTIGFWQPSPVVGVLVGDIVKYAIAVISVTLTGVAIGFRPDGGIVGLLFGVLLAIFYAFSLSWIFAAWGVVAKKPDSVAQNSMLILYTSIFCSNIFTDAATMPDWIQTVIKFNPTTHIATATRLLMQGAYSSWDIVLALVICIGLIVVFAPVTFVLYRRKDR